MYKIEIKFEQNSKVMSKLTAIEFTNKETTKFEKATGTLLKDYVQKAIKEFNEKFKKDKDVLTIDDDELDNLLKDLIEDLKDLKETMKDKKKED